MGLDPRCSEGQVDQILDGIRRWLLNPTGSGLACPVISENGTYFEVKVTFENVQSWQEMSDRVTAENIAWLFRDHQGSTEPT